MTSSILLPTNYKVLACIVGLPLAGKTHLAKLIKSKYKCTHISTGDIARRLISSEQEATQTAIHDRLMNEKALRTNLEVELHAAPNGLILLDGFPRFEDQVSYMHSSMLGYFPFIIEANVGDDVTLLKRAESRARDNADTDYNTLRSRILSAKTNMSEVLRLASLKMIEHYTVMTSGSDEATLNQVEQVLYRILPND